MSCHSLLACRVSAEKSADSLLGVPLYVTLGFSLVAIRILSLSLTSAVFIMTRFCVGVFGFILFGTVLRVPEYLFPSAGLGSFQP